MTKKNSNLFRKNLVDKIKINSCDDTTSTLALSSVKQNVDIHKLTNSHGKHVHDRERTRISIMGLLSINFVISAG